MKAEKATVSFKNQDGDEIIIKVEINENMEMKMKIDWGEGGAKSKKGLIAALSLAFINLLMEN